MKLYVMPVAPNPTRVRLYLAEKAAAGCPIELEEVTVNLVAGEQKQPAHAARNPFQRVPVLELDDGSYLLESRVIIEYLEELHPEPPLIGRDPLARARVRELERIAELGVLIPLARIVHATRSPLGLPPDPAAVRREREALPRALRFLDRRLADGRPFLAGEAPSIADCTLQAGLQFGRFGEVELEACEPGSASPRRGAGDSVARLACFEHLARWDAAYRARQAVRSVLSA